MLTGVFLLLVGWINAATYYSKAASTDFNAVGSWGANTDGTGAAPGSISNVDDFIIQNGSAFTLTGNASVRTLTINAGSLTVGSNTLTVSLATTNISNLTVNSGGTFTVSGTGNIIINGRFFVTGTAAFVQSGGTITVDGNDAGNAANSVPSGQGIITFSSSVAPVLTGGTIICVDPHANTTASLAFDYNTGVGIHCNSAVAHTFQFGNGVSTDAGGNATNGFRHSTWTGSGRFLFGTLVINTATSANPNRFITHAWSSGVRGNMTITNGEYRTTSQLFVAGNLTVNSPGILTNQTSALVFADFLSGTQSPSTVAQTVSGTGTFRNLTAAPTANFTGITINNTNPAGVTINSIGVTGTGTVSGTLTFTTGNLGITGGPFILGVSSAATGTLSLTSGGFRSGSTFRRWVAASFGLTATTPTATFFPFVDGNNNRYVRLNRFTGATTTAGTIEATYNTGSGLVADVFADGVYNVDRRSNASWTFGAANGFSVTAGNLAVGLSGEGVLVTAAAPGNAPRLIQIGAAAGTHIAGSGTTSAPFANRQLSGAQFLGTHRLGINLGDIGLFSIASGSWTSTSTWSTNAVPTALDNPLISAGNTVTVSAASTALSVTVAGTLSVTGGTLTIPGSAAGGIQVNVGGELNVAGGTVNLQDGINNNRRLTSAGTLNVSSGNLNIDGNLNITSSGSFVQSGGTITIDGNGATTSSAQDLASFNNLPANFNVTGGNLTFVDPPPTFLNTITYNSGSGDAVWGPAHITTFGNGVSTAAGNATNGFRIDPWFGFAYLHMGSLVVNGAAGTNRFLTHAYTNMPFTGNVTVSAGSDARFSSLFVGGNLLNNGLLTTTTSLNFANYRYNAGITAVTTAQSVGGSGTFQNALTLPTAMATGMRLQNSSVSGITFNIPFTQRGNLELWQGRVNTTAVNVFTHLKAGAVNSVFVGTSTAGYVDGPFRVTYGASFTNAANFFPVGETGANWISFFNLTTTAGGPVTIQAERNNSIGAPATNDFSLLSLTPGAEWVTSIVSGSANLVSFSTQIHDAAIVSGNAQAAIQAPATDFSAFGSGSSFVAAGTIPAGLSLNVPPIAAASFPDRLAIGVTGPLAVSTVSFDQTAAAAFTSAATPGSSNNNGGRFNIPALGSSGTVALTDITLTYTGTAPEAAVGTVSLWTGTFGAPVALVTGATGTVSGGSVVFSGISIPLSSGNNFFWVRFDVAPGAVLGNTIDFQLNTGNLIAFATTGGATAASPLPSANLLATGSTLIDYCAPTYSTGCASGDEIARVLLAGSSITLNNGITTCAPAPFYTSYTALNRPDIQIGSTYPISITMGTDGTQFSRVWVDFDQNGVFDAAESFSSGTSVGSGGTSTFNIVVPGGAALGFTRMRVRGGDDAAITSAMACGASASAWGETEDYIVEITSPTPASVSSISATQQTGGMGRNTTNNNLLRVEISTAGSLGTLTLNQIRFNYTGAATTDIAALGMTLWTGTSAAPFAQIGTSQNAAALVNFTGLTTVLNPGINYLWLRVNTSATAVIDNLVDASIALGDITIAATGGAVAPGSQPLALLDPAGERFIDYCVPQYTTGCTSSDLITNFSINTLSNLSGTACTPGLPLGYISYAPAGALTTSLTAGQSYTANVSIHTGGAAGVAIWIDYNQNGVFDAAEKSNTTGTIASGGSGTITVVVPAGSVTGLLRMRVRHVYNLAGASIDACNSVTWGETEDYTITMLPPPNCSTLLPFPATAATASRTNVCSGDNINFDITVPMPAGAGITYQWRRNAVNFGVVQANAAAAFAVTASGNYDVVISCNGIAQITSTPIAITVNNPLVTATTPASRCGVGSVTLSATPSAGSTIEWYDGLTSTTPVGTGNSFATPSILATTTYYASAVSTGSVGTGGPISPSIGAFGTGFTGSWQIFNVTNQVRIASFDIFPTTSGDVTFQLYNSSNVLVHTFTQNVTATSTGTVIGAPVTLNVDWIVPPGNGYQLRFTTGPGVMIRNSGGATSFYGPNYQGVVFTGNQFGDLNYWYNAYNFQIEGNCTSTRSAVAATITPAPAITSNPLNSVTICEGESTTLTASSTNLTYNYTWVGNTPGASFTVSPTTTTTYTVNGVTSLGCTNQRTVSVVVNERPATPTSVTSIPAAAPGPPITVGFCPNLVTGAVTGVEISATATPVSSIAYFENFSSGFGAGPWTANYTQVVGTETHGALSRWTALAVPPAYQYNGGTTFASTGSFAGAFGDAQGSGSSGATATLASPIIAIGAGNSSVVLTYDVSYRPVIGDVFRVEYFDGTTWTPIAGSTLSDAATTPVTLGAFATQTVTIPAVAYGGVTGGNLRIRFSYFSDWGWWAGVDNVTITQTTSTPAFTWTPATGLFNDINATLAYTANTPVSTIFAAPFNDRTYQVSTRNPATGCTSLPANINIDVCQIVIDQICGAQNVTVLNTPPANINSLPAYSNLGAPITGSLAGLCTPLKSDVWFRAVVPASGDVHAYTFSAGSGTFDLDSTVVAVYSSSDGTCTGVLTQLGCNAFNGADGHTYASASGLTPGSNVFIRVGSRQANLFPEAGRFKLVLLSGLYWTGAANNQVFTDPLNWYGSDATTVGIEPSISKSVIIPQSATSNYPFITGNVDVHGVNFLNSQFVSSANLYRIDLAPASRLRINSSGTRGGFIIASQGIAGSLPSPRVVGTGFVEFINTSVTAANNQHFVNVFGSTTAQVIFDCATGVKSNATLTTNNRMTIPNNAVLLSGGVQTTVPAVNYGGNVIGNIRYIRTGTSYGNFDYWSSPIINGTTAALSTSFGNNLYEYDNTRPGASSNVQLGWNSAPISSPVAMTPGKGFIQSYAGNGTVTFNGLPTQVDLDLPVTVSGSNNFNLVGNPYPSSLSTALFRARNTGGGKVGVGTFYFWNQTSNPFTAGNYVSVNSSNIVSGGIAPGDFSGSQIGGAQAFMVDVASAGDLEFRNDDRVPAYPSNLTQWFSTPETISLLRMKISNNSGLEHNTVVAFSDVSSDDYVVGEDSPRLPGTTGVEVYSLLEPRQLNTQMFSPLTSGRIVDLGFVATTPGQYSLSLTEFVEFEPTVRVFLEDRATNTFQNLNVNPVYQFDPIAQVSGVRFRLHFMAPIATQTSATCLGESNGKVIVSNSNVTQPVDLVLKNSLGVVVSSASQVAGEHIFQNLSSGSYNLAVVYDALDQEEMLVSVNTVGLVSPASFVMSSNNVDIADAIIEFNAGDDESIEYTWDFGDGSALVTGTSTPVHAYMAPGIYTVTLTAGNGGCTSTATTQITVTAEATGISRVNNESKIVVFPNPATTTSNVLVNWNKSISSATLNIFDATGRLVSSQVINNVSSGSVIELPVNQLSNGIYQISIEGENFHEVARFTVAK